MNIVLSGENRVLEIFKGFRSVVFFRTTSVVRHVESSKLEDAGTNAVAARRFFRRKA